MTSPDPSLADKLYAGVQLTRPLLRNITARVEADLAGTGISVGQRAILEHLLITEQATAPEITASLELKRQFVSRELKELSNNGMVISIDNPQHRRSVYYRLTAESRKIFTDLHRREMKQFAEFASKFSPEEIEAFLHVQSALNRAFSRVR